MNTQEIIQTLKTLRRQGKITFQQYATYKGQVLSGNVEGCIKGLKRKKLIGEEIHGKR